MRRLALIVTVFLLASGCFWKPFFYNVDGSLIGPACGPIGYVMVPTDSTPELVAAVHQGMAEMSQITGRPVYFLGWRYLGQDVAQDTGHFVFRFDHTLAGSSGGPAYSSSDWPSKAGRPVHTHGGYGNIATFYSDRDRLPMVRHEIGHMFGLDHVNDDSEVMNGRALSKLDGWGVGDQEGLYALSVNNC